MIMEQNRKKILIVEDENLLRNILSEHLGRNFEVTQAENGEKGLQYIINYHPDLVLLDLLLPNLSGFDLLEQVRNHPDPAVANTRVIVFSNLSTTADIMRAKVLSVSDYLVKSNTSMDELVKKITDALQQPSVSPELKK